MSPLLNNYTQLKNRTLWFDGDSTIPVESLMSLLQTGKPIDNICVDKMTDDILKYNTFVEKDNKINIKQNVRTLDFAWNIPKEYSDINIQEYITEKLINECKNMSDIDINARVARVTSELSLYEDNRLIPILQSLIFIINTMEAKQVVWGIGRGSSVSSYILYLIGTHDVDSVLYELNITDFIRTGET